jgi:hypothetical protein
MAESVSRRQPSHVVKVPMPADLVARVRRLAAHEGSSSLAPTMRRLIAIGLRSEWPRWQAAMRGREV